MVSTNDIRPGQSIIYENNIYLILEYQHVKPGKGRAFVKTKLKNITNGGVIDKTFRADEEVEQAFVDKQPFQFLYSDGEDYFFMNTETYNQISLNQKFLDGDELLLKANQEVTCETGLTLQVPMFINENDVIKIDTKTKTYMTRA